MKMQIMFPMALAALMLSLSSCTFLDENICPQATGPIESMDLDLNEFTSIDVHDFASVYLEAGDAQSVRVEGEADVLDRLDVRVANGELIVEVDGCFRGDPTFDVYIVLPEALPLETVALRGAGTLRTESAVTVAETFFLEVSGAGSAYFLAANENTDTKVDIGGAGEVVMTQLAEDMDINIRGGGDLNLEGKANRMACKITGAGDLDAFDFPVETANLDVSGSGDAKVTVNDGDLDVEISGAGSVYYRGEPGQILSRLSGAGELINAN